MDDKDSKVLLEVGTLVARARKAQAIADGFDQQRVDELVLAAGWAIMEPGRNRELSELAVSDTGIGNVEDKFRKNYRKTFGLLRDLKDAPSVGVIADDAERGVIEIARPVGVVCAVTPSTNPAATPVNKIINALKGRNAVIVAPSPKGWSTCARLIGFVHAEFDRIGAPRDLVQMLGSPITKLATAELMKQCDLVVATGSQANVRAAYASGTPAFGVGAGNVAGVVDESADIEAAADRILQSKTFDNATSCSSENSVVVVESVKQALVASLAHRGVVLLDPASKDALQALMWPDGKLSADVIGQSATRICELAAAAARDPGHRSSWLAIAQRKPRILLVEEIGAGANYPFSGEKLSPVLALYTARSFDEALATVRRIYAYQGAGHSVGLHTREPGRAVLLGESLPVSRVIVNQAHCIATGGSFDNGLPFSLSMGCGTWGNNTFSDNMNYRHYLNITRVSRPIPECIPSEEEVFGAYFGKYGR